ncbi:hypothetical protein AX14_008369 [Amanita brunnescens Koide BX004]|nr:hypothetical protein AX14_008369 [Amanita brunnescens Koide BX004]
MATYGSVDVVIPNAGIAQSASLSNVALKNGKPVKPSLATLDVNLNGVVYSTYLAQHYLTLDRKPGHLKAVVLIGSMASWLALPKAELYAASKHAVLGLMRSFTDQFASQDIRISCIHPFYADTAILPPIVKVILAGIPLATVPRIAGAIFYSATNPDPETSGNAWLILDNGPVFRVPKEEFKLGVYKMIDERRNALLKIATGVAHCGNAVRDLTRVLGKPLLGILLAIVAGALGWHNKHLLIPARR